MRRDAGRAARKIETINQQTKTGASRHSQPTENKMKTNLTCNPFPQSGRGLRLGWLSAIVALALSASLSNAPAQDSPRPTINYAAVVSADNTGISVIEVQFTDAMDPVSVGDPANYSVDGAIVPDSVLAGFNPYVVHLQFAAPIPLGTHLLSVSPNVTDQSGNPLASAPDPTVVSFAYDPPVLTSVVANCDGSEVVATFSTALHPIYSSDPFLYLFLDAQGNPIGVLEVTLGSDNRSVTLVPFDAGSGTIVPGGSYTLVATYIQNPEGTALPEQSLPVLFAPAPPAVSCSVAVSSLFPVNNGLVNVGLNATSSESDVQIQVFSDEPELAELEDATLTGGTLKLRGRRNPGSDGRVYLIVVTSTDPCGNVGVACATVVVPKNSTSKAVAAVNAEAAAAQAQCSATGSPLTPYRILP